MARQLADDVAAFERERDRDRLVKAERYRADPSTPAGEHHARQVLMRELVARHTREVFAAIGRPAGRIQAAQGRKDEVA